MTPQSKIALAALLVSTGCANSQFQRTLHTSQCVIADERLGKSVRAPAEARAYLRNVAGEAKAIMAGLKSKMAHGGDLAQEYRLLEDLLDLVTRLEACISEGKGVTASQKDHIEIRLAAARTLAALPL